MPTDCIIWPYSRNTKSKNRLDYGQVRVGDKMKKAHRVAWEKEKGPIPEGMMVLHTCDNPPCVNVGHLYLGTHLDNMRDRSIRGRAKDSKGSANPKVKITEQTAIRIKMVGHLVPLRVLASALGISMTTVSRCISGKSWKHVTANTRFAF